MSQSRSKSDNKKSGQYMDELDRHRKELKAALGKIRKLELKNEDLVIERDTIESEYAKLDLKYEDLMIERDTVESRYDDLEAVSKERSSTLKKERDEYRSKYEYYKREFEKTKMENVTLKSAAEDTDRIIMNVKADRRCLNLKLTEALARAEKAESGLRGLPPNLEALKSDAKVADQSRRESDERFARRYEDYEQMKNETRRLKRKNRELKDDHAKEIEKLKDGHKEATDNLMASIKKKNGTLEKNRIRLRSLERALANKGKENESLRTANLLANMELCPIGKCIDISECYSGGSARVISREGTIPKTCSINFVCPPVSAEGTSSTFPVQY